VIGVSGKPFSVPLSTHAKVRIGPLTTEHAFLLSTGTPVNLLGRDLLCKLHATVECSPEGIRLLIPRSNLPYLQLALISSVNHKELPDNLKSLPETLWGWTSTEVGLLKSALPVIINVKSGKPPSVPHYPIPKDAEEGLQPIINSYISQGILIECLSPCNTPILPVKKPKLGKPVYRFVQDLRAINNYVIPRHPVVPNPATIISTIPATANWYTVVNLTADNLSLTRCSTLNPAMLMPNPNDSDPHHDCCKLIEFQEKPRMDLTDVPLQNPDYVLFTNESASVIKGLPY
uniref:Peptidase A2 domain-containing protein n=1 Tax=Pelusios castaneus TaxID=367368 RepID=A0A8C8S4F1_9SAUR